MVSDLAKEKVFWTRKMNLKLVKFIEKKPAIWNPKHPKYTSIKYRDKTFSEFAAQYGDEFTGEAVKDRWTNIRSTYAQHLRKIKTSQESNGEPRQITWHLWDACQFLSKINKNSRRYGNEYSFTELEDDRIKDEECLSSNDNLSEKSDETTTTCQNIANSLLNVFRGVQNDVFGLENKKYGELGRLVTTKLTQMSSYDAAKTSKKIMDILLLYHEDNPLNPNNMKSESNK